MSDEQLTVDGRAEPIREPEPEPVSLKSDQERLFDPEATPNVPGQLVIPDA